MMKCKYCGRETFSTVCAECRREGNEILYHDKVCEKLNNIYGTIGFAKFASFLSFVICFLILFFMKDSQIQSAMKFVLGTIFSYSVVLILSGFRTFYKNKIEKTIDMKLRERHNK